MKLHVRGSSLGRIAAAAVFAVVLGAGGPVHSQQPPTKPGGGQDPAKQEAKEKKAQELWELAARLEGEKKYIEAQSKLRELRSRYRGTSFYFGKMIEISDKINELGLKVATASLQKTTMYKRPHQDSWYAYEFVPPMEWKGTPPQAQWFNEYDNSEVDYKGQTYRIARYTAPYLDKLYLQVYKTYAVKDAAELKSGVLTYIEGRYDWKLKEESKGAFQTNRAGAIQREIYSTDKGDRLVLYYYYGERRGLALMGVWRAGSEDGGFIRIITTTSDGKRTVQESKDKPITPEDFGPALKIFDQSAKTFWIYDAGTRQGMATKLDRSALCSDWHQMRSARGGYFIEYATSHEYAKKCAEELEQILGLYKQVLPTAKGIPQCRVKIFDREEDFMYYGQMPGAAAYWSPGQEEIVAYKFEGDRVKFDSAEEFTVADDRNPEEVTFKILYHEGFHQYMFYSMGRGRNVYVPSWINEGLGDYFFGGEWQKSPRKFTIGINDWRIHTIVRAIKKNKHVPFDRIINYEQMQYYRDAGLCYAQGWSMNYFFLTSPDARKKGYHMLPVKMIEALKTGGDWKKATEKVFAGVDLKKVEEEWKAFILALPLTKEQQAKVDLEDPFEK